MTEVHSAYALLSVTSFSLIFVYFSLFIIASFNGAELASFKLPLRVMLAEMIDSSFSHTIPS